MKITRTTPRAGLALGCALLACALAAEAGKPPKDPPPPDDPPSAAAYDAVFLGDPGTGSIATDINEDGLVAVMVMLYEGSSISYRLAMVVPAEDDGTPVWRKDDDLDGCNDLLRDLGILPGGAVTVEYPAADGDGDELNDHLIDLGVGISFGDAQAPPLEPAMINDRGDVAGTVKGEGNHDLPFVIRPCQDEGGGLIWNEDGDGDGVNDLAVYLPLPPRDNDSGILDMNENGTMVGWVDGSHEGWRAAIWQVDWETGTATVTKLGTVVRKYDWSTAVGVNAAGQVLGHGSKSNWPDYPVNSEKLWLCDQGEMTPVGDLVPSGTGFAEGESKPHGINDSGMIVGSWWPVEYHLHEAFILIPH